MFGLSRRRRGQGAAPPPPPPPLGGGGEGGGAPRRGGGEVRDRSPPAPGPPMDRAAATRPRPWPRSTCQQTRRCHPRRANEAISPIENPRTVDTPARAGGV